MDTMKKIVLTISASAALCCVVRADAPATAKWIGGGDRTLITDPLNWQCFDAEGNEIENAIPYASTTEVTITGETTFNFPEGQSVIWKSLAITGSVSLAANCDWRGLGLLHVTNEYTDVPKGQYIDTGFKPNQDTRVVMDVTVQNAREYWFGAWNSGYNSGAYAVGNDAGGIYTGYGNQGGTDINLLADGRHTIDYNKGKLIIDGETVKTRSANDFLVNYNLYLFAQNRTGSASIEPDQGTIRCHSCKIYANGTLVRDYVPATLGEVAGFWDNCNNYFVQSATFGKSFTIDLKGYSLALSDAISEMSGEITDTVGDSELHVDIDDGDVVSNAGVTLSGFLKLVKDGAGTFVGIKNGQTYTGGTVVSNGLARSGASNAAWGQDKALITVADGASFDFNGCVDSTSISYSFNVCGTGQDGNGAILSGDMPTDSYFWKRSQFADMELTGDTYINNNYGTANNSILGFSYQDGNTQHTLKMNGHTLTFMVFDRIAFCCVKTVGSGTIVVNAYSSSQKSRQASFYGGASDLSSVTLDIASNTTLNVETAFPVGSFIDRRLAGGCNAYPITVLNKFQPMTTNLFANIQLGNSTHLSPTLDLSGLTDAFILPSSTYSLAFQDGATVKINLGERRVPTGTKVVRWTTAPSNLSGLTFVSGDEDRRYSFDKKDDGLYVRSGFFLLVR